MTTTEQQQSTDQLAAAQYALRNTPVNNWPFVHTLVRPILPADYYQQMVDAFPEDEKFIPLSEYHPDRGALFLTHRDAGDDDLDRLSADQQLFWKDFVQTIGSEQFRKALLETMGGPELVDSHLTRTRSLIHLSLDRFGYQIRPHTDIAQKIVTALFYLPDPNDHSLANFGTSVLVEKEGMDETDPHDWNKYECAFTAPFLANSLFAFKVGDSSWHGVKPIAEPIHRRSVQYFVILDE
jgi:hypothetical protein